MSLDLYKAVKDLRFRAKDGSEFTLHSGVYGTGNGALHVSDEHGSAECKLTVNMIELQAQLAEDEFFVRVETIRFSRAPQALLDLGLFAKTTRVVTYADGSTYAEIWRFADCPHGDGKAIACSRCRESQP